MLILDKTNTQNLDFYILNEQPISCGLCGARTDFEDITDKI